MAGVATPPVPIVYLPSSHKQRNRSTGCLRVQGSGSRADLWLTLNLTGCRNQKSETQHQNGSLLQFPKEAS